LSRILVTGANGFIGRHLASRLERDGHALTLAQRSPIADGSGASPKRVAVGDIGPQTDWRRALDGCETVIHLAGQLPASDAGPLEFERVNDIGTARFVEQAVDAEVKRFVLLSSVAAAVSKPETSDIDEQTPPSPVLSPYGHSKRAAEGHVAAFAAGDGVGISIRPPLVYGPDAGGTWGMLQRLCASPLSLPFGAIRNRRSLIAVENLVDALAKVIATPPAKALSGAYFVADDRPVSVREIFAWLREGMELSPRLLPIPSGTLAGLLRLTGRERIAQQLLGDLVVDASLFRRTFGWSPAVHPHDAIRKSGAEYRAVDGVLRAKGAHPARTNRRDRP
jgi:UDP-glucose 4-epimerase